MVSSELLLKQAASWPSKVKASVHIAKRKSSVFLTKALHPHRSTQQSSVSSVQTHLLFCPVQRNLGLIWRSPAVMGRALCRAFDVYLCLCARGCEGGRASRSNRWRDRGNLKERLVPWCTVILGPASNNHTDFNGKAMQEGGWSPVQQLGEAVFSCYADLALITQAQRWDTDLNVLGQRLTRVMCYTQWLRYSGKCAGLDT